MNESPNPTVAAPPTESSTFAFDRLVVKKVHFEEVQQAERADGEQRPSKLTANLNLSVQLEMDTTRPRARVTLGVVVQPDMKWQPYQIEVVVMGHFHEVNGNASLLEEFCVRSVPSILFPYARQIVHTLTTDAGFGQVRLNPVSFQHLDMGSPEPTDDSVPAPVNENR